MTAANVGLVEGLYDALAAGDVGRALGAMSPAIVWNEADGFPYADGNPYVGPDAIASGIFARFASEWTASGSRWRR